VIDENAIAMPIECTAALDSTPTLDSSGSTRRASAGSPTKPSPMLASVMPSWVAAIASSRFAIACAVARAPWRPSCTHSSTCVFRTATSANSAATK
jgi:hypothetical protein